MCTVQQHENLTFGSDPMKGLCILCECAGSKQCPGCVANVVRASRSKSVGNAKGAEPLRSEREREREAFLRETATFVLLLDDLVAWIDPILLDSTIPHHISSLDETHSGLHFKKEKNGINLTCKHPACSITTGPLGALLQPRSRIAISRHHPSNHFRLPTTHIHIQRCIRTRSTSSRCRACQTRLCLSRPNQALFQTARVECSHTNSHRLCKELGPRQAMFQARRGQSGWYEE